MSFNVLALCACSLPGPPPRPASVPLDAAMIHSSARTVWIKCWYEPAGNKGAANECQIYNAEGEAIYDEVFLPHDGGPPALQDELEVDTRLSNFAYAYLKNGRILLPSSNFERHKALIDRVVAAEKK